MGGQENKRRKMKLMEVYVRYFLSVTNWKKQKSVFKNSLYFSSQLMKREQIQGGGIKKLQEMGNGEEG